MLGVKNVLRLRLISCLHTHNRILSSVELPSGNCSDSFLKREQLVS